jgi:hypothetical protein
MALVQGTKQAGAMTVSASAPGLESATATVTSAAATTRATL